MRKFATVTVFDPVLRSEQEALFTWPAQSRHAADLAATVAAGAPASALRDIEAMILSGDDGATPYWFTPPYARQGSARDAVLGGSDDADILRGREGADLLFGLGGANGAQACDPIALLAGLDDGQCARLGATPLHDADTAGGELAVLYVQDPRGIGITGASAAIWIDGFGLLTGLGVLL